MYGLPADFDASAFDSRALVEVCFTENTVHFEFDEEVSVTAETGFFLQQPGQLSRVHSVPVKSADVMTLLGHSVAKASSSVDGTLTLEFDCGWILMFVDDSQQYESYRVSVRGVEVFV